MNPFVSASYGYMWIITFNGLYSHVHFDPEREYLLGSNESENYPYSIFVCKKKKISRKQLNKWNNKKPLTNNYTENVNMNV